MDNNIDKKAHKPYRPVIRSQAELERVWRHLMEPLGFANRSLWLMVIDDDDRPIPHLTELTDLSERPDSRSAGDVTELVRKLGEALPRARLAFLLSRPGAGPEDTGPQDPGPPESPGAPHSSDQAWAAVVYDAARDADVPCEVVHLATDDAVLPIPWDSLARKGPTTRTA